MTSIVGVMQKVAAQEARKIYTTELGVVTAVFPHTSGSDKDNYQCSLKLKNKKQPDGQDFELRKVPVTTPHMGMVNIPNVGDLVLVTFVGGDINAPIIIGRLYNDPDQPPINKENEFLLQHSLTEGGSLKIDQEGVLTLASKDEKSTVEVKDGDITLKNKQCTIALSGGDVTIDNGTCKITVDSSGITLDAASNNVTVKSLGSVKVGDATTGSVQLGGRAPGNAVADSDDIILSSHTHVGNLGAPCPIMVPLEKLNSIQAKLRNTKVG
ncbi:MAG: phage baseplate assembly protein V [Phormidesmis sp.]